jgi:hypothetical protein
VAGLTTTQVAALTTNQLVNGLTDAELGALTTKAIAALTTTQIAALTTDQIANGLTTTQIAALTTKQIAALTTNEIANGLTTAEIASLTTAQIASLTTNQIANGLTTTEIASLTTAEIVALTTTQIASLTTAQFFYGITTTQAAVLTEAQVQAISNFGAAVDAANQLPVMKLSTPLVLDLNGNGIDTLNVSSGVQFDIRATGQKTSTGWVAPQDGLLVYDPNDPNNTGSITSGAQLFGSATVLPSGQTAANGYQALAALDSNGDGTINSQDAAWKDLKVWVDTNSDGVSETGELKTLDQLGIKQFDLKVTSTSIRNNGNWIGMESSYETTDGATHTMGDVWFVADNTATSSLQAQVSSMVQAMASFSGTQAAATGGQASLLPTAGTSTTASSGASAGAIAGLLSQFDASGNPVAAGSGATGVLQVAAASSGAASSLTTDPNKPNNAMLTSGGK